MFEENIKKPVKEDMQNEAFQSKQQHKEDTDTVEYEGGKLDINLISNPEDFSIFAYRCK